ncbi:MAG TPA: AbrB family transcriptional regulator [Thermohalobaculum sp.]|nr:AbrB family transcriptional regulator [Thermohalobaculum sp.]
MTGLPEPWGERLSRDALRKLAFGLAIGALGGWLAHLAHVPLAWMLGALFFAMLASLMKLPAVVPLWVRARAMVLVGMFLGESFDGLSLAQLSEWPLSVAAAVAYAPVAAAAAYVYYRHVARQARLTAVCSAIPGGLTAVVLVSEALGADERRVALAQVFRIAIVICMAPVIAFGLLGFALPEGDVLAGRALMSVEGFLILLGAAVLATVLLGRLGVPVPFLLGPLIVSAVLRMAGVIDGVLPSWLVEVALVVTGASIGTRFHGIGWGEWAGFAALTLGGTAILMAVSALFAFGVAALTTVDPFAALLAFAPGGVAEMSLIALAIDADPGYVAVMHVVRIAFILAAVPVFGAFVRRRLDRQSAAGARAEPR